MHMFSSYSPLSKKKLCILTYEVGFNGYLKKKKHLKKSTNYLKKKSKLFKLANQVFKL